MTRKTSKRTAAQSIVDQLAKCREEQGITFAELAERTGITRGNLARLMSNPDPNPTVSTLCRIAEALGFSLRIELAATLKETTCQPHTQRH